MTDNRDASTNRLFTDTIKVNLMASGSSLKKRKEGDEVDSVVHLSNSNTNAVHYAQHEIKESVT
jgi:hypothetical protein